MSNRGDVGHRSRGAGDTDLVRIDLHTHSTVSDGTESPAQVMRAAAAAGLDVVALTDHDSLDGWAEAADAAAGLGLEFVPGLEISCKDGPISIHMLALWPRPDDPALAALMGNTRESRIGRAQAIVDNVARDYALTWEDVLAQAADASTVGRPHIADALVLRGHFADRTEVFDRVLSNDSPYYVQYGAPDVREVVRVVRAGGGVPVFAHPGAHARGRIVPDRVIEELVDAGLVGLEVDHRDHSPEQRDRLGALAERWGLVRTGSSDYHGAGKVNRLGENLTSVGAYEALVAARRFSPKMP